MGLEILAFPCNQFGKQESGSPAEILEFVGNLKRPVTFSMMDKINVNGPLTHPVFAFLKSKLRGPLGSGIKWNFTKFLLSRDGTAVARFSPAKFPLSFEQNIVELLKQ